jgi:glycosyltransferase involved in cell wall biosynthesis
MKVCVIVTTYDNPFYLEKVLAGYLHQSKFPDELVVADDGSKDDTKLLIADYTRRAPFPIIHSWQPHDGPRVARARNLATKQSSSDYFIYTDGDCIPVPDFIKDHIRLVRPGSFVQGKRMLVQAKAVPNFTGQENALRLFGLWLAGGLKKAHLLIRIPGLAVTKNGVKGIRSCNLAVFREDLYRVNGWNERFIGCWREDSELALRLLRSGCCRRDALFSAIVFHLHHETSDRGDKSMNEQMLEEAKTGPIFVPQGLLQESRRPNS